MIRCLCLLILMMVPRLAAGNAAPLSVQAESAILINADTGAILYEKNAHQLMYPASLTKIATTLYTLKIRGNRLEKMISAEYDAVASISEAEVRRSNYTLPSYWLQPGTSHIGIRRGEELSLRDLLHGIMIASGGDACNVVAQYIGGSIPDFMTDLNAYLKELGCENTLFMNPHGLHHPKHMSTAYDIAIMTREALKDPIFREIVKTVSYPRPKTNKLEATTLIQTNRLLKRGKYYYPKAIGVKTGYTSISKSSLVSAAKDGDRTLIAVLMKCDDRDVIFTDAVKMFEEAFKEKKLRRTLLKEGQQKIVLKLSDARKPIKTYIKNAVRVEYYPSESPKIRCKLKWSHINPPVAKDQQVGTLIFFDHYNHEIKSEPLFASENVNYCISFRVSRFFRSNFLLMGSVLVLLLVGGYFLTTTRR